MNDAQRLVDQRVQLRDLRGDRGQLPLLGPLETLVLLPDLSRGGPDRTDYVN